MINERELLRAALDDLIDIELGKRTISQSWTIDRIRAFLKTNPKHIRVYATRSLHSGIWADTVNGVDKRNATLVLDEGVEL